MKYREVLVLILVSLTAFSVSAADSFTRVSAAALKALEKDGKELAILDPREEGSYGQGHLLHAVNIPLSKLELNVDASGGSGGTRTVTCLPPSYSNISVTNSPETAPVGLAGSPSDSLSSRLT